MSEERGVRHVFFDGEMTGLDCERDVLTEMAWVYDKDGRSYAQHYMLEYEGFPSLWSAQHTAALRDDRTQNGATMGRSASAYKVPLVSMGEGLSALFGACLMLSDKGKNDVYLVGACPAFDDRFLRKVFREVPYNYHVIDVEAMAMGHLGWDRPRTLKELRSALGLEGANEKPHDALQDALEAKLIFDTIIARNGLGVRGAQ